MVSKETNQTQPSRDVVDDFIVSTDDSRKELEEQNEETEGKENAQDQEADGVEPNQFEENFENQPELSLEPQVDESEENQRSPERELPKEWRYHKHHSKDNLLTSPSSKLTTRSSFKKMIGNVAYVSKIEPKTVDEAQQDENWIMAMQDELN